MRQGRSRLRSCWFRGSCRSHCSSFFLQSFFNELLQDLLPLRVIFVTTPTKLTVSVDVPKRRWLFHGLSPVFVVLFLLSSIGCGKAGRPHSGSFPFPSDQSRPDRLLRRPVAPLPFSPCNAIGQVTFSSVS